MLLDDLPYDIEASQAGDMLTVSVAGIIRRYRVWLSPGHVSLAADGQDYEFAITPRVARRAETAARTDAGSPLVTTAMPGRIAAIEVVEGQQVAQGDTVVVIEAMKMLLRLPAPIAGRVGEILCTLDQIVPAGAVLMRLQPGSDTI